MNKKQSEKKKLPEDSFRYWLLSTQMLRWVFKSMLTNNDIWIIFKGLFASHVLPVLSDSLIDFL